MKTNTQLAEIVAQRVSDRVFEDMTDLIAEITTDLLLEEGCDPTSEEAFENLMDISGRLYIGAQ
tara:strand:- start:2647 stop:2838 length:192 start_codon:yes stop_codon:yes gene_type:complete